MKRMIVIALATLLCVSFVGCTGAQKAVAKSKSSYDSIWKACIESLSDVSFSASSVDTGSGLIVAERGVLGGGVSKMNIMLTKSADGVSVSVKYIPRPGVIGGGGTVDAYVKALKERIPDIEVSKAK